MLNLPFRHEAVIVDRQCGLSIPAGRCVQSRRELRKNSQRVKPCMGRGICTDIKTENRASGSRGRRAVKTRAPSRKPTTKFFKGFASLLFRRDFSTAREKCLPGPAPRSAPLRRHESRRQRRSELRLYDDALSERMLSWYDRAQSTSHPWFDVLLWTKGATERHQRNHGHRDD